MRIRVRGRKVLDKIRSGLSYVKQKAYEKAVDVYLRKKYAPRVQGLKRILLARFSEPQLDEIMLLQGIPDTYIDSSGKEHKIVSKTDKINAIATRTRITVLFWLAKQYGVKYKDIERMYNTLLQMMEHERQELLKKRQAPKTTTKSASSKTTSSSSSTETMVREQTRNPHIWEIG